MTTTQELNHFLSYSINQKDPSLVIALDDSEIKKIRTDLDNSGYMKVDGAVALAYAIQKGEKIYLVLSAINSKDIYEILSQYATGQISYFDTKEMKILWVTPNYARTSVMILASEKILTEAESKGMPYRSIAGLTYQK
jgi:hypothetical protein